MLVAMLALPVRTWFLQQARIADAQAELARAEQAVAQLQEEKDRWQDQSFVEEQARQRLNYVRPGEVGIVVLQSPTAPGQPSAEAPRTWFDSLWQTVDSASGRGETAVGDPIQIRPTAPR